MRRIPFEVWLAALVLAANLYAVFLPANSLVMGWYSSDDAFYYFKTAQNITEGRGITFDGLGRDSGFHPLWMLVITPIFALARFDRILPLRLVALLSALLTAGTAVILYRLAKRALSPLAAAFIGLFWAFYPFIHHQVTEMGMESALGAFLIALLVYRLAEAEAQEQAPVEEDAASPDDADRASIPALLRRILPRALPLGIIAALVVMARLDNIFLVLLAGAWLAVRPARMRYLLLADVAVIGLGVLWSYMKRVGFGPVYAQSAASAYWMVMAALAIRIVAYYLGGLYRRPAPGRKGLAAQLVRTTLVSLLASALLSGVMLTLQALHIFSGFPRLVLIYEAGVGLAGALAIRLAAGLLSPAGGEPEAPLRWKPTLLRAAGYYAPIGVALVVYMAASLWYFGTAMPVSGQVKRWWGTLPNTIYGRPVDSLQGLLGLVAKNNGPWQLARSLMGWPQALPEWVRLLVYGGIALAVLIWLWPHTRKATHALALFPLFAGSFVQLISYTGTGYLHMRTWYWVSHMMVITLLLGILLDNLLRAAQLSTRAGFPARGLPRLANVLAAALSALVVFTGASDLIQSMPMYVRPARQTFYLDSIRELERNTAPGSRIGSSGGGIVAYFVDDRTVVNLDGLMNTTEYFHLLQQGRASQYLDRIGLDYVYSGEYAITSSDPYFQFKGRLEKISAFGGAVLFRWK